MNNDPKTPAEFWMMVGFFLTLSVVACMGYWRLGRGGR